MAASGALHSVGVPVPRCAGIPVRSVPQDQGWGQSASQPWGRQEAGVLSPAPSSVCLPPSCLHTGLAAWLLHL